MSKKTTKISRFEAHYVKKPNTLLSIISTKPKLSNLSCENIVNYYLDEETVTPEVILLDNKWINLYSSDIEVGKSKTRATKDANDHERQSADGESRFSDLHCVGNVHISMSSTSKVGPQDSRQTPFEEISGRTLRGISTQIAHFERQPYKIHH